MELGEYQQAALKTLQPFKRGDDAVVVPLLGLAGEAGSVATAYKKYLRDGAAHRTAKLQMREELGDVLWYVAVIAQEFGLNLDDIAIASLGKNADRWRPSSSEEIVLDADYPAGEQLPRKGRFVFELKALPDGRTASHVTFDGQPVGDPLTDASRIQDGYRFHDACHLAHAAVLGWSPVLRSLMKRKRRSVPTVDEAEDGGRAIAIEEGISALVFAYAADHDYLKDVHRLDHELLDTISRMVAHLEVSAHRTADWEKAILTGYEVWRTLNERGGGVVDFDMTRQSLTVV